MTKKQAHNLLIAIVPYLGWALAQPVLAGGIATPEKPAAQTSKQNPKSATAKKGNAVKAKAVKTGTVPIVAAVSATQAIALTPVTDPAQNVQTAALAAAPNSTSSVPPFVFAPVTFTPSAPAFIATTPTPWSPQSNPYIVQPVTIMAAAASNNAVSPWQAQSVAQAAGAIATPNAQPVASVQKASNPSVNPNDSKKSRSILPTITKVYPTGEKPMVVVTFNCPTELAGINTPSTKVLHGVFDLGFGTVNATGVLPWTLQQVCS